VTETAFALAVGVPVITPVVEFNVNPAGKEPAETENEGAKESLNATGVNVTDDIAEPTVPVMVALEAMRSGVGLAPSLQATAGRPFAVNLMMVVEALYPSPPVYTLLLSSTAIDSALLSHDKFNPINCPAVPKPESGEPSALKRKSVG
jgi:hypothetical protein